MKKILNTKNLIIGFLSLIVVGLSIFVLMRPNTKPPIKVQPKTPERVVDTVQVVRDSIVYLDGEIIEIQKTVEISSVVDTATILQKLYDKNVYNDTIELSNNLGFIFITDSITQNNVFKRSFSFDIKEPEVIEHFETPKPIKNQVYFGLNGQLNKRDEIGALGLGFMLKTKKEKIYNLTIGVSNTTFDANTGRFIPYVGGGVYWKIKLK
jgi:hypothetical protein